MADSNLHPLDPLQKHYQLRTSADGRVKTECNYCKTSFSGAQIYIARSNFKRHLINQHPNVYSDDYVMTQEDLDADFERLGKPHSNPLQFRKYICLDYDSVAKRPSFVYCVLSKLLITKPAHDKKTRFKAPRVDTFLRKADQLTLEDYQKRRTGKVLPEGYECGHVVGLGLARFSTFLHDVINALSDVAIQHTDLNHGHWQYLEELVEGLLLIYKVRIMAGTSGKLDLPNKSKAEIPRWWFMIIVTSDINNTNWHYVAFLFTNIACTADLTDYQVTIPQLHKILNYDIFPNIIDELQTDYESDISPGDFEEWATNKWFPKTITGEPDESDDEEPGPASKKRRTRPLVIDDSD